MRVVFGICELTRFESCGYFVVEVTLVLLPFVCDGAFEVWLEVRIVV